MKKIPKIDIIKPEIIQFLETMPMPVTSSYVARNLRLYPYQTINALNSLVNDNKVIKVTFENHVYYATKR